MKKINCFIANTPFQIYSIQLTIKQYFDSDMYKNVVFASCPVAEKDRKHIYVVRHGLWSIYDILKIKWFVYRNLKQEIEFFIPHLCNLISNYFFNISKKYKKPINVFYEGTAQFCPEDIIVPLNVLKKRRLISRLCRLGYENRGVFYPRELTDVAIFYTPEPDLCIDCREKRHFAFPHKEMEYNDNTLFLSDIKMENEQMDQAVSILKNNYKEGMTIYIKPHYELPDSIIQVFMDKLSAYNMAFVLLDKKKNIELYYDEIKFSKVLSQECSSALVNIKFIYGDQVRIRVINPPAELYQKLYDYYGFGKDF